MHDGLIRLLLPVAHCGGYALCPAHDKFNRLCCVRCERDCAHLQTLPLFTALL